MYDCTHISIYIQVYMHIYACKHICAYVIVNTSLTYCGPKMKHLNVTKFPLYCCQYVRPRLLSQCDRITTEFLEATRIFSANPSL
jgi:hypothetical protein